MEMILDRHWLVCVRGEGLTDSRDVPKEREQLSPLTKGPSRSPLAKGSCDGHGRDFRS